MVEPMIADDTHPTLPHAREVPLDAGARDALVAALQDRFDMAVEDASDIADVVLEQFGEGEEVNDETLDPSIRSIFYTLEAKKLLSFRREEYRWESGELRRGFWWRLRLDQLEPKTTLTPEAPEDDVYADLPKSVWSGRQNA